MLSYVFTLERWNNQKKLPRRVDGCSWIYRDREIAIGNRTWDSISIWEAYPAAHPFGYARA